MQDSLICEIRFGNEARIHIESTTKARTSKKSAIDFLAQINEVEPIGIAGCSVGVSLRGLLLCLLTREM